MLNRKMVFRVTKSQSIINSKISAEEKKERSGWGRVELGQLGTSWSSNSSGDENCSWCEDVCLRCAIFFRRLARKWEMKVLTWRVEYKKISEERYQWKPLRKLHGKESKYNRSISVSSRFLVLWFRRRLEEWIFFQDREVEREDARHEL